MILVLDSSALITLARVGRLDLLRQIAGTAHIPEAVYEEVVKTGRVSWRSPRRGGFPDIRSMIERP